MPVDRETGRPRGFAFVDYADRAVAEEAIRRFNQQPFKGRPLAVSEARPREDRARRAHRGPAASAARGPAAASQVQAARAGRLQRHRVRADSRRGPTPAAARRRRRAAGTSGPTRHPRTSASRRARTPTAARRARSRSVRSAASTTPTKTGARRTRMSTSTTSPPSAKEDVRRRQRRNPRKRGRSGRRPGVERSRSGLRLSPELAWNAGVLQSHTATQQWQSFEIRMRRRRVDRCVLRAAVAIDAGVLEDARGGARGSRAPRSARACHRAFAGEARGRRVRPAASASEAATVAPSPGVIRTSDPGEPALRTPDARTPDTPVPVLLTPTVPDTPIAQAAVPDTPVPDVEFLAVPESPRRVLSAAAALLIAISGTAGWLLFSQNPPFETAGARRSAVMFD